MKAGDSPVPHLRSVLAQAIEAGKVSSTQAERIEALVSNGALPPHIAIDRLKRLINPQNE